MQQRAEQEKKEIESERAKGRAKERERGRWRTRWTLLQFIAYALTTCLQAFLSFPHLCGFRLSCKQTKKSPSALLPHTVRQWQPAPSTQQQQQTRSVPLPEHVCGLWLARYSNICGTSCQSQHGFARTEDHTPYIATKWIVLVQFIEPKWTEHWATADLAAEARNARKVNIYAGQGAYSKWGFIQCAEMNYCANTSDEFCT